MTQNKMFDVIVVGQGAMGLAATSSLAQAGAKVLGLEQYKLFHDLGSSHGETRAIRKAYFEHESYIPLLERAYELWAELENSVEQEIFSKCGIAYYCDPKASVVHKGVCKSSELFKIPVQKLSMDEASKKFPYFRAPKNFELLFEPLAGMIFVDRALRAFHAIASKNGANIHENEKLLSWKQVSNSSMEVVTDKNTYNCSKLIFTRGGWSLPLELGLKKNALKIYRAIQYWFEAPESAKKYPSFGFHLEQDFYYGFPSLDGKSLKVAGHFNIEALSKPEDKNTSGPPAKGLNAITNFVRECLPEVGKYLKFSPCIYTMTADEHFIIDHLPQSKNVVFASGFSGHGFKFAPVIGEILAEIALSGRTRHDIDFLGMQRFAQ
jgi:sarcosine oxidase